MKYTEEFDVNKYSDYSDEDNYKKELRESDSNLACIIVPFLMAGFSLLLVGAIYFLGKI